MWIASIAKDGKSQITAYGQATLLQRREAGDRIVAIVRTTGEAMAQLDDAEGRCSARRHGSTPRGFGRHVCPECQSEALVGGLVMSLRRSA